ncbi:putative carrier [Beauveria bassiana D1-5]|uniref:Putative carrier n=1 Tax=Beauveria bassiana D1-5 TaxID=1245745 RepID=A0A0A2V7X5_BEABA|nr:putative carrier [Beauveria bassiana D1-5]
MPRRDTLTFFARSGGLVNSIATSPRDVLRTRMQSDTYETATRDKISNTQRPRHVHPIRVRIDALRKIHRTEGIRGLFRGLVPSLMVVVPAQAVKFYVYGNCKRLGAQYLGLEVAEPLVHAQAAVATGFATATATNPIWLAQSSCSPSTSAHRSELGNWASTARAAGCAKVAAVLITYPHEVGGYGRRTCIPD